MSRNLGITLVAVAIVAGFLTAYALRGTFAGSGAGPSTAMKPSSQPYAGGAQPPHAGPSNRAISITEFVIRPGAIGDITVGMTKQDALNTGYFDADVSYGGACRYPLVWKEKFSGLNVGLTKDQIVAYLGAHAAGPVTEKGIGVNSTYGDVTKAYPALRMAQTPDGQPKALVNDGSKWIGFRFTAETPEQLSEQSTVVSIEVTDGSEPDLVHDGC